MGMAYLLTDFARSAIQQDFQDEQAWPHTLPQLQSYAQQSAWHAFQQHLPEPLRFSDHYHPREESWNWNGLPIHLDRFENPQAPIKVILIHSLAINGRHLSLIAGGPLWRLGFETLALDLPGFGMTPLAPQHPLLYADWVQLVSDLVDHELARDGRPIVLLGHCLGGLLAYHATQLNGQVSGIIGTAFLDPTIARVRRKTASHWLMGTLGATLAPLAASSRLGNRRIPIALTLDLQQLTNHRDALAVLLADRSAAGGSLSIQFLASLLKYEPPFAPEDFTLCPLLLAQPAADPWTPLHLSERFMDRLLKIRKETVLLPGAGHLPLELDALACMHQAVAEFIRKLAPRRRQST